MGGALPLGLQRVPLVRLLCPHGGCRRDPMAMHQHLQPVCSFLAPPAGACLFLNYFSS